MGIFLLALRALLSKAGSFFGALLKNRYVQILIALLVVVLITGVVVDHKVSVKYEAKITAQQTTWKKQVDDYNQKIADLSTLTQKVNTVVVTQWKTRVETVVKHEKDIDTQIDASKEVKDEDSKCSLGPDFVRLYNSANSAPASGGSSAANGTAQAPAAPASSSGP